MKVAYGTSEYGIGPAGRRIQDAYEICDGEEPDTVPGFHSVSNKLRRTMLAKPDVYYRSKANKHSLAERYRGQRSYLLVPMRFNTVSGRLTGLWCAQPSFRWWVPVEASNEQMAQARCMVELYAGEADALES